MDKAVDVASDSDEGTPQVLSKRGAEMQTVLAPLSSQLSGLVSSAKQSKLALDAQQVRWRQEDAGTYYDVRSVRKFCCSPF